MIKRKKLISPKFCNNNKFMGKRVILKRLGNTENISITKILSPDVENCDFLQIDYSDDVSRFYYIHKCHIYRVVIDVQKRKRSVAKNNL
jgi:hypothetical protein